MSTIGEFVTRDQFEIRDSILRVYRNGLIKRGVVAPNVTPGSDTYVFAEAVGLQCSVVEANCAIKSNALIPDTAVGDELARWATVCGLTKQAAAGSVGPVILTCSTPTTVATGDQLYDDAGLRFEVAIGGVFSNGDAIEIIARSVGTGTNHGAGDVLRWVDTPPFADEQVVVGTGGLENGVDVEDDEALRRRVLSYLQNPPEAGNWAAGVGFAEEADPRVQKGFGYPGIEGPATWHVAVLAAPTVSSKSRLLDPIVVNGTVGPYVIGKLPQHSYGVVMGTQDVNADISFALTLPESASAPVAGTGGGWIDGTPWPSPDGSTTFRCTVTAVTNALSFTVDAQSPPQVGISHVAWFSPTTWALFRAVVVAVTGTAGAYAISIDRPFTDIAIGCYLWPDSLNAQAYVDAIIAFFALMGPGEWTSNPSALIRGFRHPLPSASWPYAAGAGMLRAITDAGEEVEDAQFLHRTDGATTITGDSGQMKPQPAASFANPPNVFVPRHISFYRAP